MNISQAAERCGLPNKTVRYYEELGLVVPQRQEGNAYRVYTLEDVDKLRFYSDLVWQALVWRSVVNCWIYISRLTNL